VLHHASQQLYALPNPFEIDSMNLVPRMSCYPKVTFILEQRFGSCRQSERNDDGEAAERVNEQPSESEFSYDWCEAAANTARIQ